MPCIADSSLSMVLAIAYAGLCYTCLMLELHAICCPYCGETFETNVDTSGGSQEYTEDCAICCRPITFCLTVDADGNLLTLEARSEND